MGTRQREGQAEGGLTRPAPLKAHHEVELFQCGRPILDDWLKKHGLPAMEGGTARTIVVCRGTKVVGYFSLAAGSVEHKAATGSLRRNAPDPVPVIILARLAVAEDEQGQGLGSSLLAEAMKRAAKAANIIGARALIVHALDDNAAAFYSDHGFRPMSDDTYFVAMKTIIANL